MIQFYALSVFLTILAGYALVSRDAPSRGTATDGIRSFLSDRIVRLILGIMSASVGFFKLVAVMRGDIPVVGDLLPAAAGMVSGFTLLLEFYRDSSEVKGELVARLEELLLARSRIIGVAAIVTGFVHFLFAQVIFL
ncbi:MAG TPA: hypothetical protein PKW82_03280 [Spirochaetales bacterium]|nr:hypothetical protein [Spirochaetales bacterium]